MNAVPPSMTPGSGLCQWAALREAGEVVAALAGVEPADQPDLDTLLRDAAEWRRELAARAAEDIAAAMQPGLCGLSALALSGEDPRAAAQALWREFALAREAVLGLATSDREGGPARDA